MVCPNCGTENSNENLTCVKCNYLLNNQNNLQNFNQQPVDTKLNSVQGISTQPQSIEQVTNVNLQGVNTTIDVNNVQNTVNSVNSSIDNMNFTNNTNVNNVVSTTDNTNLNSVNSNNTGNKINIPKKMIILIGVGVFVLVLVVVGAIKFLGGSSSSRDNLEAKVINSDSFFIRNNDGKYALFNHSGKQLTDFIFDDYDDFVDGYAYVSKDEKYGIIKSNGKMSVDFGKYRSINNLGGLYDVSDDDYNDSVILGNGKVIASKKKDDTSAIHYFDTDIFAVLENDKEYRIVNYKGKEILSIPIKEDAEDLELSVKDYYATANYNGKVYVFDSYNAKKITEFSSKLNFCVNSISEDKSMVSVGYCTEIFEKQDKYISKVIVNGKVYDSDSKCKTVKFDGNVPICLTEHKKYLLDKNMKKTAEFIDDSYIEYIDAENYAISTDKGVQIFKNGKLAQEIKGASTQSNSFADDSSIANRNLYSLYFEENTSNISDDYYQYYDINGKLKFDREYEYASYFNKNGIAVVKTDKYYLIDENEKVISSKYESISDQYGNCFTTEGDNSNSSGLLDADGKEIFETKYYYTGYKKIYNGVIFYAETKDDKCTIYNKQLEKIVAEINGKVEFENDYFYYTKDDVKHYYTYDGNEIYKEKK